MTRIQKNFFDIEYNWIHTLAHVCSSLRFQCFLSLIVCTDGLELANCFVLGFNARRLCADSYINKKEIKKSILLLQYPVDLLIIVFSRLHLHLASYIKVGRLVKDVYTVCPWINWYMCVCVFEKERKKSYLRSLIFPLKKKKVKRANR